MAVTPDSATGTVVFREGPDSLGTAALTAGVASMTTAALGAGAHSLTAAYGGNSLYAGSPAYRAYKVSFNRPYLSRFDQPDGRDFLFGSEYPMLRFLEQNGYDASYISSVDTDRAG